MIPIVFWFWSGFSIYQFLKGSDVRFGIGLGVGIVLIAGIDRGLGLDSGVGVGIDAESIVIIRSSCCLKIFS